MLLGGASVGHFHFHFDFVRPYLAGYALMTWEPRGFARSSLAGPYAVDVWADDLARLMGAKGPAPRPHLGERVLDPHRVRVRRGLPVMADAFLARHPIG